jgi:hypothetical protein
VAIVVVKIIGGIFIIQAQHAMALLHVIVLTLIVPAIQKRPNHVVVFRWFHYQSKRTIVKILITKKNIAYFLSAFILIQKQSKIIINTMFKVYF